MRELTHIRNEQCEIFLIYMKLRKEHLIGVNNK